MTNEKLRTGSRGLTCSLWLASKSPLHTAEGSASCVDTSDWLWLTDESILVTRQMIFFNQEHHFSNKMRTKVTNILPHALWLWTNWQNGFPVHSNSELPHVNCWWFVTSRGHCVKKQMQYKLHDLYCILEWSSCKENHVIYPSRTNGNWWTAKHSLECKWPGNESSVASGLFTIWRSCIQIIQIISNYPESLFFKMKKATVLTREAKLFVPAPPLPG